MSKHESDLAKLKELANNLGYELTLKKPSPPTKVTITFTGEQNSGKTLLASVIKNGLKDEGINVVHEQQLNSPYLDILVVTLTNDDKQKLGNIL